MGCSNAKVLRPPRNPIEALQFQEMQREHYENRRKKEKAQISKLRKKLARKQKKKNKAKALKNQKFGVENDKNRVLEKVDDPTRSVKERNNYENELNEKIENTIENQLKTDLCGFLLDQAIFTMEYYGNFESELTSILAEFLDTEILYNRNLEEHSVLLANPLDAAVAKWVRYKPIHGTEKFHSQLLQRPVIYIVFENIDVLRPNDANYDSISPLCKVNMEVSFHRTTPCSDDYMEILQEIKWKGYVRLKLRESNKVKFPEEVYSIGGFHRSNQHDIYKNRAISMASSGYGSDDYTYITLLNTHQPLNQLKMDNQPEGFQLDPKVLPDSCVSRLSSYIDASVFDKNDDDDEESDDDDDDDDDHDVDDGNHVGTRSKNKSTDFRNYETQQAIRRYKLQKDRRKRLLHQKYLNSKEFLCYFGELFRQKLAKQLRIKKDDLEAATYRGASIFTKDFEFIPAIHLAQNAQSWPECAFQFCHRERHAKKDPRTGELLQWPTQAMLKQIESFGFHVIPFGYAPKKMRNPFREIEWRIVFPKAERYLERHLSRTQAKILMIMKTLIKTFVEPLEKDKSLLFAMEYLRTHMFWECERDCTAWPEELLGEVLVRFIESFLFRLRHKRLRDYFIEERNLFETIPEYSLMSLYTILSEIVENPLMHLLVAFRNLETNEVFFPKLNFKKIFLNLVYDNVVDLKQLSKGSRFSMEERNDESEPDSLLDENILTGMEENYVRTSGKWRRRTCQLKLEIEKAKRNEISRQSSIESIDVEFFFPDDMHSTYYKRLNQEVESLRCTNILELLLDHFIDMIEISAKFGNTEQCRAWLNQTRRLKKVYDDLGCDMSVQEYEKTISSATVTLENRTDNDEYLEESRLNFLAYTKDRLKSRKTPQATENNAYEDVIPMDDIPPPVQKALHVWQNRLKKNQKSPESLPESKKSLDIRRVTAEVHINADERVLATEIPELNKTAEAKTTLSEAEKITEHEKILSEPKRNRRTPEKDVELRNQVSFVSQKHGCVNEGYDYSSDEYKTDRAELKSPTFLEPKNEYEKTSFIENNTQESQQRFEENLAKRSGKQKEKSMKTEIEENVDCNKINKSGTIQIELESESSNEKDEPRFSFKCLNSISIKAILESEDSEEHQLNDDEYEDPFGINYDVSPAHSSDRILDLIRKESEKDKVENETPKPKRNSRRAKNRRRQRRKRALKKRDHIDLESYTTEAEEEEEDKPKGDDCVIEIGTVDPVEEGGSVSKSFLSRYINTENILQKFSVVSPEMIETVIESKEKVMDALKNRDKIYQMRDFVKAKTLKLKGALLQSSEI